MGSSLLQALGRSETLDLASNIHLPAGALPFAIANRAEDKPLLVISHSTRSENEIAGSVRSILGAESVLQFPALEVLPHEKLSPQSDTISKRIHTRHQLSSTDWLKRKHRVVITQIRSLLQPIVDQSEKPTLTLKPKIEISQRTVIETLVKMAYRRVDLVERRGDFSVRGGLVDIFPATREHPIRVDFFGEEIDELRSFAVADQRSLEIVNEAIEILPCRELLITDSVKERAAQIAGSFPELAEMAGRISTGSYVEGMESLSGILAERLIPLHQILGKEYEVIFVEMPRIRSRALELNRTDREFLEAAWSNAANGGATPLKLQEALEVSSFLEIDEVISAIRENGNEIKIFNSFADESSSPAWPLTPAPRYRGKSEDLLSELAEFVKRDYRIVISAGTKGLLKRYDELISQTFPTRIIDSENLSYDAINLTLSSLTTGFISEELKILFITDRDFAGKNNESITNTEHLPSVRRKSIDPFSLSPGDLIVHERHGIGKFVEMSLRVVAGIRREYVVLEYAPARRGHPGDRIFVPTDSLEVISKYIGGDKPALHRIGSSDWIKSKARAKKAIKEIASELIKLYAARVSLPGFAFSPDTPWQRELEDAFAFIETPDQLITINDVKRDMESHYPMDRLVCGDVGYGKTEIAVRAAFKAIQDGKQVAILVPTTLLVQQHFETFSQRYAGFPVRLAALSRFNSPGESKAVIAGLSDGSVDLVIGTHRLLSKDISFKDLGLVVIDEEQRFGVEHKEVLKQLRANVDVLAMSATPIPRTLEMAITGIREMSTITTPPEERHPILTFVGPFDKKQIIAAIHRELLREGQIFYLHNRVESIDEVAARLREWVPEARVAVAHGQMSEVALEEVVLAFWNRDFDLLVATTIIENGIDVANANTLIVERADRFGVSQLHQLRGRVGRSRERAYAYFLYDGNQPLSEIAHDRLTTIATNTDLGAGMQVALKDLEIRGAGNLLGGEQSGHIASVGFDLYMKMVSEAVAELKVGIVKNEELRPTYRECKVEIPVTAYLSEAYIDSERLRLDIYRRIANSESDSEIDEIGVELEDRFGLLPLSTLRLLEVARIRNQARALHLTDLVWQGKFLRLSEITLTQEQLSRLLRRYPGSLYKSVNSTLLIAHEIGDFTLLPQETRADLISDKVNPDSEREVGVESGKLDNEITTLNWVKQVLTDLATTRVGSG